MSTQINAGTQLGTIGVEEVLGEGGEPNAPKRRSIEARRPSAKRVGTRALLNIAAAIVFVMSVFPVYWMVNMSFTPNAQIISRDPSFFPWSFTIQNYITAWTREAAQGQTDFPHALATSVTVTLGVLVATLLFAFLASIAVARFHFKGRRAFIVSVLIVQMIPGEAMMFTIYGMIDDWRLINTLAGPRHRLPRERDPLHHLDTARIRGRRPGRPRRSRHDRWVHEVAGVLEGHLPAAGPRPRRHRASSPSSSRGTSSRWLCC